MAKIKKINISDDDVYLTPEERYTMIFDQSPLLISHFDRNFSLFFVNKACLQYFGKTSEEMIGHRVLDFMPEDFHDKFIEQLSGISQKNPFIEMQNPVISNNGELGYSKWIDQGIFDKSGRLVGYQSIGQDITHQFRIEQDLIISQNRLVQAQKIGNMGDWEWDFNTGRVFWSDQTYRVLGFKPGEVEASQEVYHSRIPDNYRKKIISTQEYCFNRGIENYQIEYPFSAGAGEIHWIKDQCQIIYDENKVAKKISGTILDITDFKELQLSLENRIRTESIIVEVSTLLMKTPVEKIAGAIDEALEIIGRFFNGDRCYLYFNNESVLKNEGNHEWTSPKKASGESRWMMDKDEHPELMEELEHRGLILVTDTAGSGEGQKNGSGFLSSLGIAAIFAVPLLFNGKICGYLGLDAESYRDSWDSSDKPILNLLGELFISALEKKIAQDAVEREKELLRVTLMSIGDGFISLDAEGKIDMINLRAENLLGLIEGSANRMYLDELILTRDKNTGKVITWKNYLSQSRDGEYRQVLYSHPAGPVRVLSFSVSKIKGSLSGDNGVALIFRDVTEEVERQEEISFLSFHDTLTGVYNRAYMEEELARLNTERQLPLSIIIGDVNGLKLSNDVFGHQEGDRLLKVIAGILKECCRDEDIIARWGGDEFSIILPRTSRNTAEAVCERIRKACEEQTDTAIIPSIALGAASKTREPEDLQLILREAEERMYRRKLIDERSVRNNILSSLKNSLFENSYESKEHTLRMKNLAENFGSYLGLPESIQNDLSLLAQMHDVGKIAVPSSILAKAETLTDEEWSEVRKHSETGYHIARASSELGPIADYILCHHERWDGHGYPRGLKGKKIPELSRIISLVDTFEVLTSGRVYKDSVSVKKALGEIRKNAGLQFDPDLSEQFIRFIESRKDI